MNAISAETPEPLYLTDEVLERLRAPTWTFLTPFGKDAVYMAKKTRTELPFVGICTEGDPSTGQRGNETLKLEAIIRKRVHEDSEKGKKMWRRKRARKMENEEWVEQHLEKLSALHYLAEETRYGWEDLVFPDDTEQIDLTA